MVYDDGAALDEEYESGLRDVGDITDADAAETEEAYWDINTTSISTLC